MLLVPQPHRRPAVRSGCFAGGRGWDERHFRGQFPVRLVDEIQHGRHAAFHFDHAGALRVGVAGFERGFAGGVPVAAVVVIVVVWIAVDPWGVAAFLRVL